MQIGSGKKKKNQKNQNPRPSYRKNTVCLDSTASSHMGNLSHLTGEKGLSSQTLKSLFTRVSSVWPSGATLSKRCRKSSKMKSLSKTLILLFSFRPYSIPWITERINSGFNQKQDISSSFLLSYS